MESVTLYLAHLVEPKQVPLNKDGSVLASCADCLTERAVIHGCLKEQDGSLVQFAAPIREATFALFCHACYSRRLAED